MAPLTISKVSTAPGVCGGVHTLSTSLFTTAAAASDAMPLVSMPCMGEGMGRRKVMIRLQRIRASPPLLQGVHGSPLGCRGGPCIGTCTWWECRTGHSPRTIAHPPSSLYQNGPLVGHLLFHPYRPYLW